MSATAAKQMEVRFDEFRFAPRLKWFVAVSSVLVAGSDGEPLAFGKGHMQLGGRDSHLLLKSITVGNGGALLISTSRGGDGCLTLALAGEAILTLDVAGSSTGGHIQITTDTENKSLGPRWDGLVVITLENAATSTILDTCPAGRWELHAQDIGGLVLAKSVSSDVGAPNLLSSVNNGRATVWRSARTFDLGQLEVLNVEQYSPPDVITVAKGNPVHVQFHGRVDKIELRAGSSRTDLRPRLIEVWYANDDSRVVLAFWGWAWGLLWGAKRLLSAD